MNDLFLQLWFYAEVVAAIVIFRAANAYLSPSLRQAVMGLMSLLFIYQLDGSNIFMGLVVAYAIIFPLIGWVIFSLSTPTAKRMLIGSGILFAAVIMLLFKYPYYAGLIFSDWPFIRELHAIGWIGLSYMTFRAIDLLLYAGASRTKSFNFTRGVTYLLFFAPFIAGPINRFRPYEKAQESHLPDLKRTDIRDAAIRISIGLFKIIVVSRFFYYHSILNIGGTPDELPLWELALRLYAYLFFIYFDFSGYCDIAITLGQFFGVPIPENFNFPLLARNLQDFWNRWHISLSHWCRDHIFYALMRQFGTYLPRLPNLVATAFSIFVTFFLVGAWHGDASHWLLYGFYHGFGLSVWVIYNQSMKTYAEGMYASMTESRLYQALSIFLTISFVAWGLIITTGIDTLGQVFSTHF